MHMESRKLRAPERLVAAALPWLFVVAFAGLVASAQPTKPAQPTFDNFGADQSAGVIEVGAGEAIFNKHNESYFRLTGLMRDQPGPAGFGRGDRWVVTPVPENSSVPVPEQSPAFRNRVIP
jgi:hypothetical protein